jgi:hypothetical protein
MAAIWVHIQEDETLEVKGQFGFVGQAGSLHCEFVSDAVLNAGQTTGTGQFDVDNGGQANDEEQCSIGGALVTVGCTDVEQVTVAGLPFVLHAHGKTTLDVTTGTIQTHLTGGALCLKTLQLTPGTVTIQTTEDWWEQGHLSGELQLHTIPDGGTTSPLTITETVTFQPTTFGLTP